jgi:hypothetical protein
MFRKEKEMDFNNIKIIPTKRNSGAVIPTYNNILLPKNIEWPPTEIVQKFYKSKHITDYDEKYHNQLKSEFGYYCDLSSIKSEDSITWSLFGYISKLSYLEQNNFYKELLKTINYKDDELISIELWKKLPHPETFAPGGPEIDTFILGKKYYIIIECKWTSNIGKNQGKQKNLNQIQIRNMFIENIGKKIYLNKHGIVLLVANQNINNNLYISWDDFSKFESLPHKELFTKYLDWKKKYIRGGGYFA